MSDTMSDMELEQHVLDQLAQYNLPIEGKPGKRTPPFQASSKGDVIRKLHFPEDVSPKRRRSAVSRLIGSQRIRWSRNRVGGLNGEKTPIVLFLTDQPTPTCVMTARSIADKDGLVRQP